MKSSVIEKAATRSECIDVVTRLFRHYDRRDYDEMYALMTADAIWHRPDGSVRVGPEMQAAMARRLASLAVVHVLTNMIADVRADDEVHVQAIMTIYRDDQGALSPPPAKMNAPTAIIDTAIICRLVENDWRVASIDIQYLFRS